MSDRKKITTEKTFWFSLATLRWSVDQLKMSWLVCNGMEFNLCKFVWQWSQRLAVLCQSDITLQPEYKIHKLCDILTISMWIRDARMLGSMIFQYAWNKQHLNDETVYKIRLVHSLDDHAVAFRIRLKWTKTKDKYTCVYIFSSIISFTDAMTGPTNEPTFIRTTAKAINGWIILWTLLAQP